MSSASPHRSPLRSESVSSATVRFLENKPTPYTPKCTSTEYVRAVAHHAQQSSADTLYPGEGIYEALRRFLEQEPTASLHVADDGPSDYAWLISPNQYTEQSPADRQSFSSRHLPDTNRNRGKSEGFSDPDTCIEALRNNIEASQPQVLFLRGHPTPQWLTSIGAFCYVDPELFRWFLRYRAGPSTDYYFDSAPSTMSNIFRFKYFSIGSRVARYRPSQRQIDDLREAAADDLQKYRTGMRGNFSLRPGDSVVRNFHVLDERHCVIEQEVSVAVFDVGRTWMAIACTDAGRDLMQGSPFQWIRGYAETLPASILPIIQYKAKCVFKSRNIDQHSADPKKRKNAQSLAVFPEGFGRNLDWTLAASDRFYALADIFRLAAFSQKQLLNVMKEKVLNESSRLSYSDEEPTLSNLLYFRDILQDQVSSASYMLDLAEDQNRFLQTSRRSSVNISNDQRGSSDGNVAELQRLFQDLRLQAQSLQEKCTQRMVVISNSSILAESQRAIKQAKLVTKLTFVAFVYLPFTFTASFFGMNFKELGNGTIHLWIFFAASIPLMLVTLSFFVFDRQGVKKFLRKTHFAVTEKS